MARNSIYENSVKGIAALIGGIGFMGAAVLGYQILQWLKTGVWIEMPLSMLFVWFQFDLSPVMNMEWQGTKKIILWFLDLPLSLVLPVVGGALAYLVCAIYLPKESEHA